MPVVRFVCTRSCQSAGGRGCLFLIYKDQLSSLCNKFSISNLGLIQILAGIQVDFETIHHTLRYQVKFVQAIWVACLTRYKLFCL